MQLKVLHNNSCSKSNAILEYLDENDIHFEIIDIVNEPLSVSEIKTVLKKLGLPADEIVRKNEKLYQENYSEKQMNEDEIIEMLHQNPSLIQRPIIIKGSVAMIGRPLENVKLFLEK